MVSRFLLQPGWLGHPPELKDAPYYHRFHDHSGHPYWVPVGRTVDNAVRKKLQYNVKRAERGRWCN